MVASSSNRDRSNISNNNLRVLQLAKVRIQAN
jgi:hypothetical protein